MILTTFVWRTPAGLVEATEPAEQGNGWVRYGPPHRVTVAGCDGSRAGLTVGYLPPDNPSVVARGLLPELAAALEAAEAVLARAGAAPGPWRDADNAAALAVVRRVLPGLKEVTGG